MKVGAGYARPFFIDGIFDMRSIVLAIDQSTQGTKAVLFDSDGRMIAKRARPHDQLINDKGWVSHDAEQIMTNVLATARDVCKAADVRQGEVRAIGISNQRETCLAWDRIAREPLAPAIVWQCGRASELCEGLKAENPGVEDLVQELSGLSMSPFFSAAKMAWLLQNVPDVAAAAKRGTLCLGTIDSWLVFKLTQEHSFVTEPSNACRTQLLDLRTATWSPRLLQVFGIPQEALATVYPSDSVFGHTTMGGLFEVPVPICCVLGDSQAALAAQNCVRPGDLKATYGTGSSVMMQVGKQPVTSSHGLVSSIAWQLGKNRSYVLEGNLNYTGAVVSWLKDQMGLISDPSEVEGIIAQANPHDRAYFVPAFTGLGAPWWVPEATGMLTGVTRTTGRAEMVKACAECIPYQIADVVDALRADTGLSVHELRADGGVTANGYLMQLQADVADVTVVTSSLKELSAAGVAYVAGLSAGIYEDNAIYRKVEHGYNVPAMSADERSWRLDGWHDALRRVMA